MLLQLNRLQYVRNVNSNAAPSPFIYKRKKQKTIILGQRQVGKKYVKLIQMMLKNPAGHTELFLFLPPPIRKTHVPPACNLPH